MLTVRVRSPALARRAAPGRVGSAARVGPRGASSGPSQPIAPVRMAPSSVIKPVFTAVESFDAQSGDRWTDYIRWSGLTHVKEIVSLDSWLFPSLFDELTDEDWNHNVHADGRIHLFRDLPYLLQRVGAEQRINVLALVEEPSQADLSLVADTSFRLKGFDLVGATDMSALTNCGGFDKAFSAGDLSDVGLLPGLEQAYAVRDRLKEHYPDEGDADCLVWAIWRMEQAT